MAKPLKALKNFFELEAAAGLMLMMAAVLALICANTDLARLYNHFIETQVTLSFGEYGLSKPFLHWINDGLMAIFFLLIGLEIKREVLEGELSSMSQALLPAVAALGGMMVPALIYSYFNWGDETALRGWAIPSATDIAFSLGVLALLGARVPLALKVFLMAVAVFDDLGAIIIIALFYTDHLAISSLLVALLCVIGLLAANRFKVTALSVYMVIGLVMWAAVLKSGVHATIAGVVLGLLIPHELKHKNGESMLRFLEHSLHPWVSYLIVPLFAFANAGVSFDGITFDSLLMPIPLGIILGLFLGKQLGIFAFSWAMIKAGFANMPQGMSWLQFYGISLIAGIGFTMSLFIGALAFAGHGAEYTAYTRLGVMAGSLLSAVSGFLILKYALRGNEVKNDG